MTSLQIARKARLSPSQYQQALLGLMNIRREYTGNLEVQRVVMLAGFMLKYGINHPPKTTFCGLKNSYNWRLVLSARDLIVSLLDD